MLRLIFRFDAKDSISIDSGQAMSTWR